ncbi:MAG: GNAT family N-acetyltransferase [Gammaproteobacteria bacterium]|nr:MAG: GNAT family N-acetyltransferase [Gammaproteobacteria bacterium]
MSLLIQPLDHATIKPLVKLASIIWHEHYDAIIGDEQVDYMLEKFQSEKAIAEQQTEGYRYFAAYEKSSLRRSDESTNRLMGYFSIIERENSSLFISKFYLSSKARGKGYGRKMLEFIESNAKKSNKISLDLTVNKFNNAYEIYLKLGFEKVGDAQFDIGRGYIMDDYLLTKKLA